MAGKPTRPFLSDRVLLGSVAALLCFSLLMIYSTTAVLSQEKFNDPYYFLWRQGLAALLGTIAMMVFSYLDIDKLRDISGMFFVLAFICVLSVFVPGLGLEGGGARRWIKLGMLSFQPSEAAKLFMVIFTAGLLTGSEERIKEFTSGIVKPAAFVIMLSIPLLLEPDFGGAVVIVGLVFCMMIASGARLQYVALCMLAAGGAAAALIVSSPYRMKRVISFLFPWDDASGKGYQLIQSLIAVGSGRVYGTGLGASQQKLFYLPAAHTDFIFAVIAEELGFLGCLCVIAAFIVILWRGVLIAGKLADDTFTFSLSVGLTMMIVLPAFLNIGVVIGILPTKGMVLPLISYGGSNLVISLMAVGLLLSLASGASNKFFHKKTY